MDIKHPAKAGSLESNDIYVMVEPSSEEGIVLELDSIVMRQFGRHIEAAIKETVTKLGIDNIRIVAKDRGALDFTIKARVETAVKRALEE
ncbi:MAG: Citrate lyase acyl carrier protein [Candidatus Dichloromethanomonas elyunquensis]|nr:MAG: Citrate lyase acyl carrier protein [Candidatus Dichloromethanomonas elyunquensis]